jgi:CBS domain-containing protein
MRAADVMTPDPISIDPEASISDAVQVMLKHRFSGLPVVDKNGALVGVVTEGDLLRRTETGTQRKRPGWIEFVIGAGRLAAEYQKAAGRKVSDVMTPDVHSVKEDTPLAEVVPLMERHRIKRVLVVRGDKLVGMLTRANLLHALAIVDAEIKSGPTDDASIRDKLYAKLKGQPWAAVHLMDITVRAGTVYLWGTLLDERQRGAIRVAAENIPGVKNVVDNLIWIEPTTGL